jgi:hypothetical protein
VPGRERNDDAGGELSEAVLGVLSFGDRVAELSSLSRADGKSLPTSLASEFFLGLISFSQTLRASIALAAVSDGGVAPAPVSPAELREPRSLLR